MRLKNKTALITGASRNIGKTIALTFAREGADLILAANKSVDELGQTSKECEAFGVRVLPLQADICDSSQVDQMVHRGEQHFGKIDILVGAAGIRNNRPFWELTREQWHDALAVNLHAMFYLAKALAPGMMKRRSGNIIGIGGLVTLTSGIERTAVRSSKTGLQGLIRSIAIDLGPYGVRANMVIPGPMETVRHGSESHSEGGPDVMLQGQEGEPAQALRKGRPQDVANTVLYLASDESSHVTGDRIICAGGAYR